MEDKIQSKILGNQSRTPRHDKFLLKFSKNGELLNKIILGELNDKVKKIEDIKLDHSYYSFSTLNKKNFRFDDLEIKTWTPEYAILRNSFYIGSIDLFVDAKFSIIFDDESEDKYRQRGLMIKFLFEFKPEISSFSEVLRQVNVYKSYIENPFVVVVTYSDISEYKEVFESQGIKLIQIEED